MLRCEKCGETIGEGVECYQVRWGHLDENGDFEAEEDVAYFCHDCGIERGNY